MAQRASTRRRLCCLCCEGEWRELDTISRIDRMWINAPMAFLVARVPTTWIEGGIFGVKMLSDHVRIGSRWRPPRATHSRRLPRWVAADASFSTVVEALAKEAEIECERAAFARLERASSSRRVARRWLLVMLSGRLLGWLWLALRAYVSCGGSAWRRLPAFQCMSISTSSEGWPILRRSPARLARRSGRPRATGGPEALLCLARRLIPTRPGPRLHRRGRRRRRRTRH